MLEQKQTWMSYEDMLKQKSQIRESTPVLITTDLDTHIREFKVTANDIPDFFDQCEVLEIVNLETHEQLYRDQDTPDDPYMPYIAETLMEFLKEIDFI